MIRNFSDEEPEKFDCVCVGGGEWKIELFIILFYIM